MTSGIVKVLLQVAAYLVQIIRYIHIEAYLELQSAKIFVCVCIYVTSATFPCSVIESAPWRVTHNNGFCVGIYMCIKMGEGM